jgi:hypothetical protein
MVKRRSTQPRLAYFHAFWTRPWLAAEGRGLEDAIELWDFEALVWLLSLMEVRRHSPITLVTDTRGKQFAERTGLVEFYNGGITTALDTIPHDIVPTLFWDLGKIFGYTCFDGPMATLDTDAVLWKPLRLRTDCLALHTEPHTLEEYRDNCRDYEQFGLDGPGWDWSLPALNTAVCAFADPALARDYVAAVFAFARRYSAHWQKTTGQSQVPNGDLNPAMPFIEQRFLPMFLARQGKTSAALARLRPDLYQLVRNPRVSHMWSHKLAYKFCPSARTALVKWLIRRLRRKFPETRPLLQRWRLADPAAIVPRPDPKWEELPEDHRRRGIFRLPPADGRRIRVRDACFPVVRCVPAAAFALAGEHVVPGLR